MPVGVTDRQLTKMRTQVAQLLPGTAVISAEVYTPDGTGGGSITYSPVSGGTVPCRIDPYWPGNDPITVGDRAAMAAQFVLTVAWDAPLAANRRVSTNGKNYQIIGMATDQSWAVSRRAYVTRIEG